MLPEYNQTPSALGALVASRRQHTTSFVLGLYTVIDKTDVSRCEKVHRLASTPSATAASTMAQAAVASVCCSEMYGCQPPQQQHHLRPASQDLAEPLSHVISELLASNDLDELPLDGKRVLLRADLNVPVEGGIVTDASRIAAVLPTVKMLQGKGARVIIASHFGRPSPKKQSWEEMKASNSLQLVAEYLRQQLGASFVGLAPDCIGDAVAAMVHALQPGQVSSLGSGSRAPMTYALCGPALLCHGAAPFPSLNSRRRTPVNSTHASNPHATHWCMHAMLKPSRSSGPVPPHRARHEPLASHSLHRLLWSHPKSAHAAPQATAHHMTALQTPGACSPCLPLTRQACLLENTRFHAAETSNDDTFAAELGKLADVFVNDAFGVCHRDQASVTAITRHVPASCPGPLVRHELKFLGGWQGQVHVAGGRWQAGRQAYSRFLPHTQPADLPAPAQLSAAAPAMAHVGLLVRWPCCPCGPAASSNTGGPYLLQHHCAACCTAPHAPVPSSAQRESRLPAVLCCRRGHGQPPAAAVRRHGRCQGGGQDRRAVGHDRQG